MWHSVYRLPMVSHRPARREGRRPKSGRRSGRSAPGVLAQCGGLLVLGALRGAVLLRFRRTACRAQGRAHPCRQLADRLDELSDALGVQFREGGLAGGRIECGERLVQVQQGSPAGPSCFDDSGSVRLGRTLGKGPVLNCTRPGCRRGCDGQEALVVELDEARLVCCSVGLIPSGYHRGHGSQERLSADDAGVDLCGVLGCGIHPLVAVGAGDACGE